MFTNPFERKHSALRQTLDRIITETRMSFRAKKISKGNRSVSGSVSSVASSSSSSTLDSRSNFTFQKR